jgi:hypothetical protein
LGAKKKKDHHENRGGLANAWKRMDCRWRLANVMTTIQPATKKGAGGYSPTNTKSIPSNGECQVAMTDKLLSM